MTFRLTFVIIVFCYIFLNRASGSPYVRTTLIAKPKQSVWALASSFRAMLYSSLFVIA